MYDVVVVGARCSGAAMATLLARSGHRVLMVDKDARDSDMQHSTHCVQATGAARLRRWGLLPALEAACQGFDHYDFDLGALRIQGRPPAVEGDASAYCPRRYVIDGLLVEAAEKAGAEYRSETRVDALLRDGAQVTGVTIVDAAGARDSVLARMVVGADGPGSTVARLVGAAHYAQAPAQQVTVWGYWHGVSSDRLRFCAKPGLGLYCAPMANDQLMIGVNWAMAEYKTLTRSAEQDYYARIADLDPKLNERLHNAELSEPLRRGSTRNFLRVPHGPGWVLVGDAGHKKDPCTAQGISDAFVDVEQVAAILDRGLRDEIQLDQALKAWHVERDARLLPRHHLTIQMASFAAPSAEELGLYRAIEAQPAATTAFLGLMSGATDPSQFFAPENLARIVAAAR